MSHGEPSGCHAGKKRALSTLTLWFVAAVYIYIYILYVYFDPARLFADAGAVSFEQVYPSRGRLHRLQSLGRLRHQATAELRGGVLDPGRRFHRGKRGAFFAEVRGRRFRRGRGGEARRHSAQKKKRVLVLFLFKCVRKK